MQAGDNQDHVNLVFLIVGTLQRQMLQISSSKSLDKHLTTSGK